MSASTRSITPDGKLAGATLWVAALVAAGGCASPAPQARRPAALPAGQPLPRIASYAVIKEEILPSGLRILLEEDPYATLAGVVSVVRGGSGLDPAGAEGVAHLVEHLTYRAVDPAPAGQPAITRWDRLIKLAVADMNGHTTPDGLLFYEFASPGRLRALLALALARLGDPLAGVDQRAFALEQQIIGSEHLVRADPRAGQWAVNALFPRLFPPRHPYARPTGGTEESRHRLTLADARDYAARAFRPDRITLLVTAPPGAISLHALAEALTPALRGSPGAAGPGRVERAPSERPAAPPPAPAAAAAGSVARAGPIPVERVSSPLPAPELWLGWTLPGGFDELAATESLLERWLQADLRSSHLAEEEPRIRHVSVQLQPGAAASALMVRVILAAEADPDRAAQLVAARVSSLWSREPTARGSLAALGNLSETEHLLDEPGQRARALGRAIVAALGAPAQRADGAPGPSPAVTSSTMARFAYQYLTPERTHAVVFAPTPSAGEAARLAPSSWRDELGAAATASDLVAGASAWDPAELVGLLPPASEIATTTLPSGLTVITARRRGAAAVAWLGFRGGYADADPPLLVELALRTRPDAWQAGRLHILSGRGATRDLTYEAVEFLPAQLPEALTLLFAKATSSIKKWPSREELHRLLAPLAALEDESSQKAERAFWRALFGDHPYARVVSSDDLDRVTLPDVEAWLQRVRRNPVLVVVGDISAAEVSRGATVLSRQLAAPTRAADLPTPPAVEVRAARGARVLTVVTARPGGLADIRLGCLLPPMVAADRGSYELLQHAVAARLNTTLRIDEGDGYGVSASYERLRDGTTYLVASTSVADKSLARTLAALRGQWRRWGQDGFDATEINVARWRYAGELSSVYASPHALASQLLNEWSAAPAALAPSASLRPDIAGVGAGRVGELFATCKANAVLGLTGNEPLIRRALESAWPGLPAARGAGP